jgi:putative CocE/NonD family hydrolase
MKYLSLAVGVLSISVVLSGIGAVDAAPAATLPSEIPEKFVPTDYGLDFDKRTVMIPMRDGVRLNTIILVPKGAHNAPILLTRTPYDADDMTSLTPSAHLRSVITGYDHATDVIVDGGYIRVVQDIRGKYGSEGDYVMNRPMRGPQNPTTVDHATDTFDTIDWLVKNIPETNGKVGILGISYDGYLALTALVDPHPALKVAVPMNPMVDGWRGDDWFHNGAFRQQGMPYIYEQEATRSNDELWWSTHFDDYDMYLAAGSAGELGRQRGMEQIGFWRKLLEHPSYDNFWSDQAMDRVLAQHPLNVPVMLVHSLWDQEDIYGDIAVYKSIEPKDVNNDQVFLVIGPWDHGQAIQEASQLGALHFGSATGHYFREQILRPFLDHFLKDAAPPLAVAPVTVFETGANRWRELQSWPSGCVADCLIEPTPLYLTAGAKLSFETPSRDAAPFDEYVSDPAKPVPYRARPIRPTGYTEELTWWRWLVDDQREASGRTDVLTFVSEVLTSPMRISGEPIANLVASTSGTDSDWVVKLIDVYPDEYPAQPEMGGYQLMIAGDIFRGRYRESFEVPKPIRKDAPLLYRFALPTANHQFLPGHRVMVQVQSSWFPLYDRNPQTFVDNIFLAQPDDYRPAVQRVYHTTGQASFIELPLVKELAAGAR